MEAHSRSKHASLFIWLCVNAMTVKQLKHLLLFVFQDELLSLLLELADWIAHHHLSKGAVTEERCYKDLFVMPEI